MVDLLEDEFGGSDIENCKVWVVLEAVAAFTKKENIFDLGGTNPLRLEVLFYHSPPTQEWYLLQCESYLSFCADMATNGVLHTQMYALSSIEECKKFL